MNIIIAGGGGFLGTNLAQKLLQDKHNVIIVDNFCTGRMENWHFLRRKFENVELSFVDITKFPDLNYVEKFWPLKIDQIYHLASPASPPKYTKLWRETILVNTVGTFNLLELAKKYNAKFLFAGTSERYGDPEVHPQNESYFGYVNPFGPRANYDSSKRMAEGIIYEYIKNYKIDAKIALIFNTYGPYMDIEDGRVITEFIKAALLDSPIPIFGDGSTTRSFCYVDDQIEGLITLMNSNFNEPTNIGNPNEVTLLELVSVLEEILGRKFEIKFCPKPQDDPHKRCPDISKMKSVGWTPRTQLKEGLKKTIEYMKKEMKL